MLAAIVATIDLALGRTGHYNAARYSSGITILVGSVILVAVRDATPQTIVEVTILGGFVSLFFAGRDLPWTRVTIALRHLRRDLAYGRRVFLTSLLGLVNLRLDILLMTAFLGASQIAWYTVAVGVMLPMTVVTSAASSLITPAIARGRDSRAGTSVLDVALVRRTALRYSLLTLAMAVVLAAAIPWALPLLFGRAFAPSVALAWILLPGFVAQGYAYIVDAGMVGMRKPWVGNASEGLGVAFTLGLLPFLLPRYGATGAAITSTFAYSASASMSVWALSRIGRTAVQSADGPPVSPVVDPALADAAITTLA
jgi:O-antigen/teichoic acid export membrane protein